MNSDIEILNKNQEKIISFIHKYLEYNGKNKRENEKKNKDVEDWDDEEIDDNDNGTEIGEEDKKEKED